MNDNLLAKLKEQVDLDQLGRNEYVKYLQRFPTWEEARDAWVKDKSIANLNDIFDDKRFIPSRKALIGENLEEIIQNPELRKLAWLLVQHMDQDVSFQKKFLDAMERYNIHLEKDDHDPSLPPEEYRLLHDRISVNTNQKQKYNTQNAEATMQKIKSAQKSILEARVKIARTSRRLVLEPFKS